MAVNLGFLHRSRFFIQVTPNYAHEAEWNPFQTHYFSENLVAPGIEPGTSASVAKIPVLYSYIHVNIILLYATERIPCCLLRKVVLTTQNSYQVVHYLIVYICSLFNNAVIMQVVDL
jgi:hypothetical protein